MKLSELISELQKIADQGDDWKDAEVEIGGTSEENMENGGPDPILDIDALAFTDHILVLITKGKY